MAINNTLYRLLRSGGITGRAAVQLADDTSPYSLTPTAVTDAPALTSTDVAAAPTAAEYNALRADLAAVRTRLNALLAERR